MRDDWYQINPLLIVFVMKGVNDKASNAQIGGDSVQVYVSQCIAKLDDAVLKNEDCAVRMLYPNPD